MMTSEADTEVPGPDGLYAVAVHDKYGRAFHLDPSVLCRPKHTTYATPAIAAVLEAFWQGCKPSLRTNDVLLQKQDNPADDGIYRRGKDGRWYRPRVSLRGCKRAFHQAAIADWKRHSEAHAAP